VRPGTKYNTFIIAEEYPSAFLYSSDFSAVAIVSTSKNFHVNTHVKILAEILDHSGTV
jgi:hypothetical protein